MPGVTVTEVCDIAALADFFVKRFATELKKKVESVHPEAQKLLMRHNWPGNIRELQNVLERAMLLAEQDVIGPEHLTPTVRGATSAPDAAFDAAPAGEPTARRSRCFTLRVTIRWQSSPMALRPGCSRSTARMPM